MPKSPSNRELLVAELREIVTRYQEKPSTLLGDLEEFLDSHTGPVRRAGGAKGYKPTRDPVWKIMGFKSEKAMRDFESRSDFPGWDAL